MSGSLNKDVAAEARSEAEKLANENSMVRASLVVLNCSRQLYDRTSDLVLQALKESNIRNPEIVLETLQTSVQNRCEEAPMEPAALQDQLLQTVVPFVDILQERHVRFSKEPEEEKVSDVS
jgi:hypothetical protein